MWALTDSWTPGDDLGVVTRFDLYRNRGNSWWRVDDPWPAPFRAGWPAPLGEPPARQPTPYPENPFFADLDGDGRLDVIEHSQVGGNGGGPPHSMLAYRRNTGGSGILVPRVRLAQSGLSYLMARRAQKYQFNQSGQIAGLITYDGYNAHVVDIDGSGRQRF